MADNTSPDKAQLSKPVRKRALKTTARTDIDKDGNLPPPKKKRSKKKMIALGILGVLIILIILAGLPHTGTIKYGLCKTFVELNDPYPQSLEFVQASEEGQAVFIDYIKVDGFGQRSLNQIRCFFKDDKQSFYKLDRVDVNGKNNKLPQEEPAAIEKFNNGITALIANKPSLIMPNGLPEDIEDYK